MQENLARAQLDYKERREQQENIKDVMRQKDAKSTEAPGEKGSFFQVKFFWPGKVLHQEGCDRQGTLQRAVSKGHWRW